MTADRLLFDQMDALRKLISTDCDKDARRAQRRHSGSGFVLAMREPPYDRSLALASQVQTMRDHYLEVACGCGERRVIGLGVMAGDRKLATATLAHVALRITCHGCRTGSDEVHLCATVHGRVRPTVGGGDVVWTMPLVTREARPSYHLRHQG